MRRELFIKEKEQIEKKSIQEQKIFYQNWLEKEQKKSDIRILSCFSYAKLFYQEGSCFTVTIPFEIDHEPASREEEKTERMDLSGMRFLVVEDNELNMEIVEFLLTEEGATIDKAQNGLEALEKYEAAEAGTYQVILMDLMMPVMDGYQAAREIRALDREDARRIPIIAMSANAFPEDVQASLDAGMNAHMEKPFQMDHLFHILKNVSGYSL